MPTGPDRPLRDKIHHDRNPFRTHNTQSHQSILPARPSPGFRQQGRKQQRNFRKRFEGLKTNLSPDLPVYPSCSPKCRVTEAGMPEVYLFFITGSKFFPPIFQRLVLSDRIRQYVFTEIIKTDMWSPGFFPPDPKSTIDIGNQKTGLYHLYIFLYTQSGFIILMDLIETILPISQSIVTEHRIQSRIIRPDRIATDR